MESEERNPLQIRIATVLTRLISPVTATLLGLIVIFREYISTGTDMAYNWLIVALGFVAIAIVTMVIFLRTGIVSNWDITDRKERPKVLFILTGYFAILIVITALLGYTSAVPILSILTASMFVATFITLFWKISFHTFAVTLFTLFVIGTYNEPYLLPLLVLPFITAWTRIVLKRHTQLQAMGGILLGLGVFATWIYIFA